MDASRAVVVEDVSEQLRVAVEEVLACLDVAEVLSFFGAEQGVWEAFDGLQPGLVVPTAHVQRQFLTRLERPCRAAVAVVVAWQTGRHGVTRYRHPADG